MVAEAPHIGRGHSLANKFSSTPSLPLVSARPMRWNSGNRHTLNTWFLSSLCPSVCDTHDHLTLPCCQALYLLNRHDGRLLVHELNESKSLPSFQLVHNAYRRNSLCSFPSRHPWACEARCTRHPITSQSWTQISANSSNLYDRSDLGVKLQQDTGKLLHLSHVSHFRALELEATMTRAEQTFSGGTTGRLSTTITLSIERSSSCNSIMLQRNAIILSK